MDTAEKLAAYLRDAALAYELSGRKGGPEPTALFEVVIDGCRYKIRAEECADGLRDRADRLLSKGRRLALPTKGCREAQAALRFKPSSARSRYSEKVAAELAKEDPANAEAYRDLFDA